MTRFFAALALCCLFVASGCAAEDIRDNLFGVFGSGYTGGGVSRQERKDDFDRQAARWSSSQSHFDSTAEH